MSSNQPKNRLWITAALTIIFVIIVGIMKPSSMVTGMGGDQFWANKLLQKPSYDIVVAGDSRIYRGLSPEAMTKFLNGYNIFNYGFGGVGLSSDYIVSARHLLAPDGQKILIVGVTPHSLTPKALEDNVYFFYKRKHVTELYQFLYLGDFFQFLEPYPMSQMWRLVRGGLKVGQFENYSRSGWVATERFPSNPAGGLETTEKIHFSNNNRVTDMAIKELLKAVRELSQEGILVVGFRPPTTNALRELEDQLGGFREAEFVRDFERAGGVWLSFPFEKYETYNGGHLGEKSAKEFSRDIASAIKNKLSSDSYLGDLSHEK